MRLQASGLGFGVQGCSFGDEGVVIKGSELAMWNGDPNFWKPPLVSLATGW